MDNIVVASYKKEEDKFYNYSHLNDFVCYNEGARGKRLKK